MSHIISWLLSRKNQQFQINKDDGDNLYKCVAYSINFVWSLFYYMTRYVLIWFLSYDLWYNLYHAISFDVQWRFCSVFVEAGKIYISLKIFIDMFLCFMVQKSLFAKNSCGFYRKYLSIDQFVYICPFVCFPFSLSTVISCISFTVLWYAMVMSYEICMLYYEFCMLCY